jgi:hypothetical protein
MFVVMSAWKTGTHEGKEHQGPTYLEPVAWGVARAKLGQVQAHAPSTLLLLITPLAGWQVEEAAAVLDVPATSRVSSTPLNCWGCSSFTLSWKEVSVDDTSGNKSITVQH